MQFNECCKSVPAAQDLCMSRDVGIRIVQIFWGYLKSDKGDISLEQEAPDSLIWAPLQSSQIYAP
jgi:hypothetical protein